MPDKNSTELGDNIANELLKVRHQDLIFVSEDSIFKKECPICTQGWLLVRRDPETMTVTNRDNCTWCGQSFEYVDYLEIGRPSLVPEAPKTREQKVTVITEMIKHLNP